MKENVVAGKTELLFFPGLECIMSKVILEPRTEGRVLCDA